MEKITNNLNNANKLIEELKPILSSSGVEIQLLAYYTSNGEMYVAYLARQGEDDVKLKFYVHDELLLWNPHYEIVHLGFVAYKIYRELIDLAEKMKIKLYVGG